MYASLTDSISKAVQLSKKERPSYIASGLLTLLIIDSKHKPAEYYLIRTSKTDEEMLEAIHDKEESECRSIDSDWIDYLTVLHFLGRSPYYKNKNDFTRITREWTERVLIESVIFGDVNWDNYGIWRSICLKPTFTGGAKRVFMIHIED